MLTEAEVPCGARVYLFMPGESVPTEYQGDPVVFRALESGIPKRKKFFEERDGRIQGGLEDFEENRRFSPVETYNPEGAPTCRDYVVFEAKGKRAQWHEANHDGTRSDRTVSPLFRKMEDGTLRQIVRDPPNFMREYRTIPKLPEGAILVPVSY